LNIVWYLSGAARNISTVSALFSTHSISIPAQAWAFS
jgi:hypothetical protein